MIHGRFLLVTLIGLIGLVVLANLTSSPPLESPGYSRASEPQHSGGENRDFDGVGESAAPAKSDLKALNRAEPDELLQPVHSHDIALRQASAEAADRLLAEIDSESIVRWRGIYVDSQMILPARTVSDLQDPDAKPADRLRISPFPDVSFVVTKRRFDRHQTSATWVADITEGGNGYVDAHLVPDDDGQLSIFFNIRSDKGNFNLAPTDLDRFYVIAEANPHRSLKID